MNAFPDDPIPAPPIQPERKDSASGPEREDTAHQATSESSPPSNALVFEIKTSATDVPAEPGASGYAALIAPVPETPRDPAWSGLDVLRLVFIAVIALFVGVFTVLLAARTWLRPHASLVSLARVPLIVVAGQALAYLLVLAYMYVLVTRERGQTNFLAAIHWNWPQNIAPYLGGGVALSLALQLLAHILPMPKNLPIDLFFRTPAEAWALTIFGITLAPLMEELFFRGFLYPVLARGVGLTAAIFFTGFAFALLHGSQLMFSWGPVLVIFLVGTVLTMVRAYKNSVAAGLLVHVAYNGTLSLLMFVGTDGFRHLEKLNQ
ncbi:MAG: type II CAAX endopeptidase family protein [Terriglobales bacterium]